MATIDLYHHPVSAVSRAVRMGAAAYGIKLNLKEVDIFNGEQLKPDFLKMNPQHTVPTMDDRGFYLFESRAILQYFANAYGTKKTEPLYPVDPKKRALIDQRLLFDMGTLYSSFANAYYPKVFGGELTLEDDKLKKLNENLGLLETFLSQTKYVAGNHLTIADFSIVASLATMEACKVSFKKFPNVANYLATCKNEIVNHKDANQVGATEFGKLLK